MNLRHFPFSQVRAVVVPVWMIVGALPLVGLISGIILRDHAGPFWLWSNLDPDYWYLLDSLNLINLNWPVHIAHPGTPLQVLGAFLIKSLHPLTSADQITQLVLANPEPYLQLINGVLIIANALALGFIGWSGYLLFNDRLVIVLLQLAPFISKLTIKWMTHVAPEPLLIIVVLVLSGVSLLALRPGQLAENRDRYALLFGLIAGFGMATKVTSVGVYFLPVFLLWAPRPLFVYGCAGLAGLVIFTLPAAGSYGDLIAHLQSVSGVTAKLGDGSMDSNPLQDYWTQFRRVTSRPAIFVVFFASLTMLAILSYRWKFLAIHFPLAGRLLAGLCFAELVQALIVARHPSGHYMIPILVLAPLGLALIYRLWLEMLAPEDRGSRYLRSLFTTLCLALIVAQTLTTVKLSRQFRERAGVATALDDDRFNRCARIFFWSAASPSYALQLGNNMVGNPFSQQLENLYPTNDYWYEIVSKTFRDWRGPRDIRQVATSYPCLYARGVYANTLVPELQRLLPNYSFSRACSPQGGHETLLTARVDCQGNLQ